MISDIVSGFGLQIFTFATTALEQFLDYLIEFPQFCNHILQISHLRVVHPELFVYAEHVLARSSSGLLELHTVSSDTADPRSGSTPATLENLEVSYSSSSVRHKKLKCRSFIRCIAILASVLLW